MLSLDPTGLKAFIDRLGKEKLDSKFPTINQYFSKFPTMGIAWAVDDFYRWQQTRYLENENLLRIQHLCGFFVFFPLCFFFFNLLFYLAFLLREMKTWIGVADGVLRGSV